MASNPLNFIREPGHPLAETETSGFEGAMDELVTDVESDGLLVCARRFRSKFESHALLYLLERTQGNVADASQLAKIPRTTFQHLLYKHDIRPEFFRRRSRAPQK